MCRIPTTVARRPRRAAGGRGRRTCVARESAPGGRRLDGPVRPRGIPERRGCSAPPRLDVASASGSASSVAPPHRRGDDERGRQACDHDQPSGGGGETGRVRLHQRQHGIDATRRAADTSADRRPRTRRVPKEASIRARMRRGRTTPWTRAGIATGRRRGGHPRGPVVPRGSSSACPAAGWTPRGRRRGRRAVVAVVAAVRESATPIGCPRRVREAGRAGSGADRRPPAVATV